MILHKESGLMRNSEGHSKVLGFLAFLPADRQCSIVVEGPSFGVKQTPVWISAPHLLTGCHWSNFPHLELLVYRVYVNIKEGKLSELCLGHIKCLIYVNCYHQSSCYYQPSNCGPMSQTTWVWILSLLLTSYVALSIKCGINKACPTEL